MKKFLLLAAVVFGLALYFEASRFQVGGVVLSEDRHALDSRTKRFLEDIQFKDFAHAETFHHPDDRKAAKIAALIEKKFFIKPEHLDIQSIQTMRIDVSGAGDRGKVTFKANVKFTNLGKKRDVEGVLYWKKRDGEWWMALRSSL